MFGYGVAKIRIKPYFSNPAVEYYLILISGGNIDDSKAKLLKPLDDECREIGIRVLIGWLMDYENDFPKYKNDVMQYMGFCVIGNCYLA